MIDGALARNLSEELIVPLPLRKLFNVSTHPKNLFKNSLFRKKSTRCDWL